MSAYDNLAVQYFYLGDLVKSRYYNNRMIRGKSEARFSVVRKIAAANSLKTYKKGKSASKQIFSDLSVSVFVSYICR